MGLAQPSMDDPGSPQVHVSQYPRSLPLPASKEPTGRLEENASHNGRSPVFKSIYEYAPAAPIREDIFEPKDGHSKFVSSTRSLSSGSSPALRGSSNYYLARSPIGKVTFSTRSFTASMRDIESHGSTLSRRPSMSDFVAGIKDADRQARRICHDRARAQSKATLIHEVPPGIPIWMQIFCFLIVYFSILLNLFPPLLFRWRSMKESVASPPALVKISRADRRRPDNSLIQHKDGYITHSDRQKKHGGAEVDQTDCKGYLPPNIDCPDISRTSMLPKEFPIAAPCKAKECLSTFLPTTINDLQEPPTTNTRTTMSLDPNPAQKRRFHPWEIGDCVNYIQEHSQGPGWMERSPLNKYTIKKRHSGIPTVACPDFRSLLYPRRCYMKHRWPRLKRSGFKSCLAASSHYRAPRGIRLPGIQRLKAYSTNFSGEPGSGGVNLLNFPFYPPGFGHFFSNSDSANEDEIDFGQGPGSELLQGLGIDHELLRFIDPTEPGLNILAPQFQYHAGDDLPVQQPSRAPNPPVPLSVNLQFDARGPEENTGVPAPEISTPQPHHRGASKSAMRPPSDTPPSENSRCDTHGPDWYDGFATGCLVTRGSGAINRPQPCTTEWNKGFFDGCMFASRTLGQSSEPQPQPNLAGCSTAAPTPTIVPNVDVESSRTTTGLDHPTVPPPTPPTLRSSITHAVDDQPQAQPGPSNTQMIARRDTSDDIQIAAASTSQELRSRRNDASTNSHIGPIRNGSSRNIYKCDICEKGFPQRQRLDNHVKRDHLGRPNSYSCNFPGCDKLLASEDGLKRHHKKVHNSMQGQQF